MHWRFNSAALFVGSPLHAVHGVLLNHMMNVTAVGVVFTMHFVMLMTFHGLLLKSYYTG
jgi:hypothetical protein